jgi:hypothetical protein
VLHIVLPFFTTNKYASPASLSRRNLYSTYNSLSAPNTPNTLSPGAPAPRIASPSFILTLPRALLLYMSDSLTSSPVHCVAFDTHSSSLRPSSPSPCQVSPSPPSHSSSICIRSITQSTAPDSPSCRKMSSIRRAALCLPFSSSLSTRAALLLPSLTRATRTYP